MSTNDSKVFVHTSLPPKVSGQTQFHLDCDIPSIDWFETENVCEPVAVRVLFWGEDSPGAIFDPVQGRAHGKRGRTHARYEIKSGIKQFRSYMKDMAVLNMDVVALNSQRTIGRARVLNMTELNVSSPIRKQRCSIFNDDGAVTGELTVSLAIIPAARTPPTVEAVPVRVKQKRKGKPRSRSSSREGPIHSLRNSRASSGGASVSRRSAVSPLKSVANSQNSMTVAPTGGENAEQLTEMISQFLQRTRPLLGSERSGGEKEEVLRKGIGAGDCGTEEKIDLEKATPLHSLCRQEELEGIVRDLSHSIDSDDLDARAIDLLMGGHMAGYSSEQLLKGLTTGADMDVFAGVVSDDDDPAKQEEIVRQLFFNDSETQSEELSDDTFDDDISAVRGTVRAVKRGKEMKSGEMMQSKVSRHPSGASRNVDTDVSAVEDKDAGDVDMEGLSATRLELLGRVTKARLSVDILKLLDGGVADARSRPSKIPTAKHRKPPVSPRRPGRSSNNSTYIIEYQLPGSPTAKVLAKSVAANGTVKFDFRTSLPVLFDGRAVQEWWKASCVFRVHVRQPGQKMTLVGTSSLALRRLLTADGLALTEQLDVQRNDGSLLGHLEVVLELASDAPDFGRHLTRTEVAEATDENSRTMPVLPGESAVRDKGGSSSGHSHETFSIVSATQAHPAVSVKGTETQALHLMVIVAAIRLTRTSAAALHPPCAPMSQPLVTGMTAQSSFLSSRRNVYLVARLLWPPDRQSSPVVWGCNYSHDNGVGGEARVNFVARAPYLLNGELLERLREKNSVVEVWEKKTTAERDQLLGLATFPLNQFFQSFSTDVIRQALLKSKNPVVALDTWLPVMTFAGACVGEIRIMVSMGSTDQADHLQRATVERLLSAHAPNDASHTDADTGGGDGDREEGVEFVVEVTIESLHQFQPTGDLSFGECDCFLQYSFPCSSPHRTPSTPLLPDSSFQSCSRHRLVLPSASSLHSLLLSHLAPSEGLPVDLWVRHYSPNLRERVAARGIIPLSQLCGLLVGQRETEVCRHVCIVPLHMVEGGQSNGAVHISLACRRRTVRAEKGPRVTLPSESLVVLTVGVERALGLKMAMKENVGGVNSYARFWLSWRPEMMRQTRCVARSFCPEFGHHAEFPCRVRAEEEIDRRSLAEVMDNDGKLHVQIFHQVATCPAVLPLDSSHVTATHGDILLGSAQLPLSSLLARDTPLRVILPLRPPQSRDWHEDGRNEEEACGGVEVVVGFTGGASDRRRIVEAGREEGFVPKALVLREEDEGGDALWTETDEFGHPYKRLSVNVDWTDIPVSLALLAVMTELPPSAHLYVRYKLYNKPAVRSRPLPISEALTESRIRLQFGHTQHMTFRVTPCLLSYLREESLELQVWIRYGAGDDGDQNDQRSSDRLLGFSKLDLSSLCAPNRREHRILRTLPLFKRGVSSMDGAKIAVRVAISGTVQPLEGEEMSDTEDGTVSRGKKKHTSPNRSFGPSFAARVLIDRGSRLKLSSNSITGLYVTYMSTESLEPQRTTLASGSAAPKWRYSRETHLAERHLTLETPLLFRLWQRTEREDSELGHASVDLSNLRRGFERIQGWYNVNDVQGECIGQLSITVMPLTTFSSSQRETCHSPVPPPVELSAEPTSRSFLLTNLKEKMNSLDTILRNADDTFPDPRPFDLREKMSNLNSILRNADNATHLDIHPPDLHPMNTSVAAGEEEEEDMVYVRALNDVSGLLTGLRERIQGLNQQREETIEESAVEAIVESQDITGKMAEETVLGQHEENQDQTLEDFEVEQEAPEPLDVGILGMGVRSRSSSSSSSSSSSVSSESSDSSSTTSSSSSDDNLEPPAICLKINEGAEETSDLVEIPAAVQNEMQDSQARQLEERRIRMRQEMEKRREEARIEEEKRREEARNEEEKRREEARIEGERRREEARIEEEEKRKAEMRIEEEKRIEEAKRKIEEKKERKRLKEEEQRRQREAKESEIRAAVEEEMRKRQRLEEEERRRQKQADEERMAEEEKRREREKLMELTRGRLPNLCPPTTQNTAEKMKYLRLGRQTPPPEEPLSREQMRIQAARELLNRMKREREDGSRSQHQYGQKEMDRMEKIFHMKF